MSSSLSVEGASDPAQSKRPTAKHQFEIDRDLNFQSFVFLHDNVHIVSATRFGAIYKWNCDTGLLVGEPWVREGAGECVLVLSPDGKTIACGRNDGSIQQWNKDGKMIEDIWAAQSSAVLSLSWSPCGGNIACGSKDGKILILKVENGKVEVGPIGLDRSCVDSLAYSPSGDRVASGGQYRPTCIWDSNTGELLVGPIEDSGKVVKSKSLVWSSDSSKLYCTSEFGISVRVFDSISGTLLDRLEHDTYVNYIALSPTHNVLAGMGACNIQLWDTESHRPLGNQFHAPSEPLSSNLDFQLVHQVSFSRDGRYLASSRGRNRITLWMVKDITPQLTFTSLPCLNVDATKPSAQPEGDNDVYDDFFRSSEPSPSCPYASYGPSHLPRPSDPSRARRMWNAFISFRHRPPANESIPLHPPSNRSVFSRRTGPKPVTVSAGRPRTLYWIVPRPVEEGNGNGNGNTNSSTAQLPSAATRPQPTPHNPQHSQTQAATQSAEKKHDYGCWGNFCLAVWCIPRVVPAAQSTPS
ncbi:WD40 repeat-like protein [Rhizopogon salebrosus TDB-379]|nr:WD40 repeat-like protein [Rhizopogon salebrosus TDB-379]